MSKEAFHEMVERLAETNGKGVALLDQCVYLKTENSVMHIGTPGASIAGYVKNHLQEKMEEMLSLIEKKAITVVIDANAADYSKKRQERQTRKESTDEEETPDLFAADEKRQQELQAMRKKAKLKEEFRFENFVNGQNNLYNVAVAQQVAQSPGKEHNPLFIYGGVGLGKTHVLQSIGNRILETMPEKRVLYTEARIFREEFVNSLFKKKPEQFKLRYRSVDVFLLDDIQLLETGERTSKELFDLYQSLDEKESQMVFISDRPPRELQSFDERLRNRFERSIILCMEPPEFETRIAIIETKLKELGTTIPRDIIEYIAEHITTDVRKITGAIRTYVTRRDLMGATIDLDECKEQGIFRHHFTEQNLHDASTKEIMEAVCKHFDVPMKELLSAGRNKYVSRVRHIAVYLAAQLTGKSTTELGADFKRDHATIIYAKRKIANELKENAHTSDVLEQIKQTLADMKR